MKRKQLKLEVAYVKNVGKDDSVYVEAMYDMTNKNNKYLYRMGKSGTRGAVAGEMLFHNGTDFSEMSSFADEVVEDFESMVKSLSLLKEIDVPEELEEKK